MIAIDFETALIEPGLQAPPPVCMSYADQVHADVVRWEDAHDLLKEWLKTETIVGANLAFDLAVPAAQWPDLLPLIFQAYDEDRCTDIIIRQKLIDIATGEHRHYRKVKGYSLAALTSRLLDRHLEKEDTWRKRYWELIDCPLEAWPKDAIEYSLTDSVVTRDCYYVQEHELAYIDRLCVLEDQYRRSRADFALKLMSAWGLRTDAEGVETLRKNSEKRLQELEGELLREGLLKPVYKGRGKNRHQVGVSKCVRKAQERMAYAMDNPKLTKKGLELRSEGDPSWQHSKYLSLDEEACLDSGDLILEKYSEYSSVGNFLTGHVKAMEEGVCTPIHAFFDVLMDTGRTSSSGPNVQNVRRAEGARECFIPRDGWCYIGCDYDKAELHTLAQCCIDLFGRSSLADALNAGYDPHTGLGARLAHTTYEDLLARIKAGDPEAREWRQRAKPGNFGFPGGMGAAGMVKYAKSTYGVIMTFGESEALYRGWKEQWPEVANDYLGWIREITASAGHATIEHFVSHRWRGHVPYCAAANSFFQGRAADAMLQALYAVTKLCYLPGTDLFGCRVVNEIHDEFLVEAPLDCAAEAAEVLRKTMIEEYNHYVPDVPVKAAPVLMDRWSKKAEEVRNKSGRLQVWKYAA